MKLIKKSKKLNNVLYDIRGPIVDRAKEMEAQGQQLIKLNIGNLASFDFQVPEEIQRDMILNLPNSAGYSDSKGIFAARKAVMHYTQELGIRGVTLDDIYLGNGASDLISLATNALLDEGDELLIPMPDYPLWTATTSLSGGTPVHYLCDEENGWQPDLDDIRAKITPRTRGIVIINPNNPTGVVYDEATIKAMAAILEKKEKEFGTSIVLISDEPYRELAYDGAVVPYVTKYYRNTVVCYSYSKSLSLPGERIGYLVIPSEMDESANVFQAATIANRVLGCVNAPSLMQRVIKRCVDANVNLEAYDRNRNLLYNGLKECGFSCIKPEGAFYLFVKSPVENEKEFCEVCKQYNVLVVPGSSFACPGYVRIAYCVSYGQIERSLPAFRKIAEHYNLV